MTNHYAIMLDIFWGILSTAYARSGDADKIDYDKSLDTQLAMCIKWTETASQILGHKFLNICSQN